MSFSSIKTIVGNPTKASDQVQLNENFNVVKARLVKKSALVYFTSNETIASGFNKVPSWDAADYDDASFWSGGSPTRLTIPSGIAYATFTFAYQLTASATDVRFYMSKNGGSPFESFYVGGTAYGNSMASPVLQVSSSDYFEINIDNNTGGNIVLSTEGSWFSVEGFN